MIGDRCAWCLKNHARVQLVESRMLAVHEDCRAALVAAISARRERTTRVLGRACEICGGPVEKRRPGPGRYHKLCAPCRASSSDIATTRRAG